MTNRFMRGMILSTTAVIAGILSFYTAWNVWLSQSVIKSDNRASVIETKIDVLLQRNGVDPMIFK